MTPHKPLSPCNNSVQMTSNMDTFKKFEALLDEGKFEEASELLADDFEFSNPKYKFDKQKWLKEFPALHKDKPDFAEIQPGSNDKELKRMGKK